MLHLRKSILLCLLAMLPLTTPAEAQEVKLIAHPDVQTDSLSASDVKDIFLGKKSRWDNGGKITFFISKEPAIHSAFLKSYIGQSAVQFTRNWRRCVFGGRGKAPKSSSNNREMVNLVAQTSGAIGYVSEGTITDKVKTLSLK